MKSSDAIKIILDNLKDEDVAISTTGFISRRTFALKDRSANFYMIGSMGLVSAVGLGIALNSQKRVVILDGDGSALMDMGTMAMIAAYKPKNLIYVVLDNGSYESTGGQSAISRKVDISEVAAAAGFKQVFKIDDIAALQRSIRKILSKKGPAFLLLKVGLSSSEEEGGRVSVSPESLTRRIMGMLQKGSMSEKI